MAQIQPILPTLPSQPAPVNESPTGAETAQFSPHLANAINQQNTSKDNSPTKNSQASVTQKQTSEEVSADNTVDETADDFVAENSDELLVAVRAAQEQNGQSGQAEVSSLATTLDPKLAVLLQDLLTQWAKNGTEVPTTIDDLLVTLDTTMSDGNAGATTGPTTAYFGRSANFYLEYSNQLTVNAQFASTSDNQLLATNTSRTQDTMLAQLQQIINNSSELGQVSINTSTGGSDGTLSIAMTPVVTELVDGNMIMGQAANSKPATDLAGDRQSTHQQYYETKMTINATKQAGGEEKSGTTSDQPQQDLSQSSGEAQKGSTFSQAVTTTATSATTTTLDPATLGATTATSTTVISTNATGSTITLPSGIVVQEHEVLQQLVERFQIFNRPSESRLNIRLHPAELGELKIDLRINDGAIRANVMAQSQQVQEIIEKNMAKLRTILEDQGFTVDEITVANQSETINDFNMFDNHFFNDSHFGSDSQQQKTKHSANLVFDAVIDSSITDTEIGVNVTA